MSSPDILITGAGPTGLVLALSLARQGLRPRIIDKSSGAGQTSRALAVQARTLLPPVLPALADDAVAAGIKLDHLDLRRPSARLSSSKSGHVARVPLGDFGSGLSPYPYVLSLPQDDHERLLIDHLARAGVTVERDTELTALAQTDSGFRATLTTPGGREHFDAAYVCGCDGAKSFVRQALGIEFPAGTYDQVFYVADAFATFATDHHLPLHEFPATRAAEQAGLAADTAYLIRPDRHLAGITPGSDPAALGRVLRDYQITPASEPAMRGEEG